MVTNASVINHLFEEGLDFTVYHRATMQEYAAERTGFHPKYIETKRAVEALATQIHGLEASQPTTPAEVEQTIQKAKELKLMLPELVGNDECL